MHDAAHGVCSPNYAHYGVASCLANRRPVQHRRWQSTQSPLYPFVAMQVGQTSNSSPLVVIRKDEGTPRPQDASSLLDKGAHDDRRYLPRDEPKEHHVTARVRQPAGLCQLVHVVDALAVLGRGLPAARVKTRRSEVIWGLGCAAVWRTCSLCVGAACLQAQT